MPAAGQQSEKFQQFLDQNQYSSNSILRYEKIFGRGFVSTGGLETTQEIVAMLSLKPGQNVLDVGCGIGGSAFYMVKTHYAKSDWLRAFNQFTIACELDMINACCRYCIYHVKYKVYIYSRKDCNFQKHCAILARNVLLFCDSAILAKTGNKQKNFKVEVLGVDLSKNMIDIGKQRAQEFKDDKVEFVVADITTAEYEPESFDVIYSRDTILHIEDKETLFKNFLKWLKPGGELLISDYCRGAKELSDTMKAYIAKRHYHLLTPADYGKLLEKAGFVDVKAIDNTKRFIEVLTSERARFETDKNTFLEDFTKEDFEYLVEDWETKIVRCGNEDQKWGLFHAKKSG